MRTMGRWEELTMTDHSAIVFIITSFDAQPIQTQTSPSIFRGGARGSGAIEPQRLRKPDQPLEDCSNAIPDEH